MSAGPDQAKSSDPRRKAFFAMNGAAAVFVAGAALVAWLSLGAGASGAIALVLVLVGIGLAIGSYPLYSSFIRDEFARRGEPATRRRRS
jgi:hypothetical protein